MKIGIYTPNWIGDAVMALPFINGCRSTFPDAQIAIIAKAWVAPIYRFHPAIDKIITFEDTDLRGYRHTTRSGRSLISAHFDRFYLLSDSLRTGYLAWISGSRRRIGFADQFRSPFLTDPVKAPREVLHRADRYLRLLEERSLSATGMISPGITLIEKERSWAAQELETLGLERPLAVFPASVAQSRSIPVEKWAGFLRPFHDRGFPLLFMGGQQDQAVSETIIAQLGGKGNVTICGNYSLRESMALIARCRGALATDSGLGHIAANLGLKAITIFGAGDPAGTRPRGPSAKIVVEAVDCAPCCKNKCKNRKNPLVCLWAIPDNALWDLYEPV